MYASATRKKRFGQLDLGRIRLRQTLAVAGLHLDCIAVCNHHYTGLVSVDAALAFHMDVGIQIDCYSRSGCSKPYAVVVAARMI
jgi:hypothetical protein